MTGTANAWNISAFLYVVRANPIPTVAPQSIQPTTAWAITISIFLKSKPSIARFLPYSCSFPETGDTIDDDKE